MNIESSHGDVITDGIDLDLIAPAVHRIMLRNYYAALLSAMQDAAKACGWAFIYTKEEHHIPAFDIMSMAHVMWPAATDYTKPLLKRGHPETFKQWASESFTDEGWGAAWVDHALEALRELGIRPVPIVQVPDSQPAVD